MVKTDRTASKARLARGHVCLRTYVMYNEDDGYIGINAWISNPADVG